MPDHNQQGKDRVLQATKDRDIKFVSLWLTDVLGSWRASPSPWKSYKLFLRTAWDSMVRVANTRSKRRSESAARIGQEVQRSGVRVSIVIGL